MSLENLVPDRETLELGDLPRLWRMLEQRYDVVYRLGDPAPTSLTARAFDLAQPAGHRGYFTALRYLGVAMDNHRALLALLEHHGATNSAPWSLLRPMFESGFYACWVLDPVDGRERRIRGLRCEVNDERERKNYLGCLAEIPVEGTKVHDIIAHREATVGKVYRDEATALGVRWDKVNQKINLIDELPRLRFLQPQDDLLRATMKAQWRVLSGLEHGLAYAMLQTSDSSSEAKVAGGTTIRLTIRDDAFITASKACIWLLLEAIDRYERLHNQP